MSSSLVTSVERETRVTWLTRVADYAELTKPRILSLVLVTVGVSALVAGSGRPDLVLMVHTLLGTTLIAASGAAFNQLLEWSTDSRMDRTATRPIPSGKITRTEATLFGCVLIVTGVGYLALTTNALTTSLAVLTWVCYVWIYTPLKQLTVWNTVVGAIPGALPILIGWTGVGYELNMQAFGLFAILFFWQFPHFMAIAWLYREQYANAGYKMMTSLDANGRLAGIMGLVTGFAVLLVAVAFMADVSRFAMVLSGFMAGVQWLFAVRFLFDANDATARSLLRISLLYLPAQFALVAVCFSGII